MLLVLCNSNNSGSGSSLLCYLAIKALLPAQPAP
jgi:hypothetical protein